MSTLFKDADVEEFRPSATLREVAFLLQEGFGSDGEVLEVAVVEAVELLSFEKASLLGRADGEVEAAKLLPFEGVLLLGDADDNVGVAEFLPFGEAFLLGDTDEHFEVVCLLSFGEPFLLGGVDEAVEVDFLPFGELFLVGCDGWDFWLGWISLRGS